MGMLTALGGGNIKKGAAMVSPAFAAISAATKKKEKPAGQPSVVNNYYGGQAPAPLGNPQQPQASGSKSLLGA